MSPAVVHIVGKDREGNARGGSGIVVDAHHVLTCRHVVADMSVDRKQRFQGKDVAVVEPGVFEHDREDVAMVRVREALTPVAGLVFLARGSRRRSTDSDKRGFRSRFRWTPGSLR